MGWRLIAALGFLILATCAPVDIDTGHDEVPGGAVSLANGKRLFWAGGCASCHVGDGQTTARAPALGGGRSIATPFGAFRAPNISPDGETGIGGWTLAEFDRALRAGIAPDGRVYYPAFPYPFYARLSARDVADLHAYLRSLPPVTNRVAPGRLVFPASLNGAARAWRALYFRRPLPVTLADPSELVARGQFLVEGPGHCGACHSPRDGLGGPLRKRWLSGAETPDESFAPNLTPHGDGLQDWSEADIVAALRARPSDSFAAEGMAAVRANLAHLPESDLKAIAAYLSTLPPVASPD